VNPGKLIVLPSKRDIERTAISTKELQVIIRNLELAIQAAQNALGLALKQAAAKNGHSHRKEPQ
jgi:hypothetical protein